MSRLSKGKEGDQVMFHVKMCKKSTSWGDAHGRVLEFGEDALQSIHVTPSPSSGAPRPRTPRGWPLDAELEARTGDVLWGVCGYWQVPPRRAPCPGSAAPGGPPPQAFTAEPRGPPSLHLVFPRTSQRPQSSSVTLPGLCTAWSPSENKTKLVCHPFLNSDLRFVPPLTQPNPAGNSCPSV